jgi:hypothetical protein
MSSTYQYDQATYDNWTRWDTRDPNKRFDVDNPLFSTNYKSRMAGAPALLRGYMRAADPATSGSGGWARLFFQYNPNLIVRESVQTVDVYSGVQQLPSDQQGVGQQSFSFSLMLDRQAEVASSQSEDPRLTRVVGGVTITDDSSVLRPRDGVLVDLAVFDKITGIGNMGSDTSLAGGNAALMSSAHQIRVFFSPQMMVEGQVTRATVTMEKFNHKMVPVFCQISVTMIIRYWGSAVLDTGVGPTAGNGMARGEQGPVYSGPGAGTGVTTPATRTTPVTATPPTRRYITPIKGPF